MVNTPIYKRMRTNHCGRFGLGPKHARSESPHTHTHIIVYIFSLILCIDDIYASQARAHMPDTFSVIYIYIYGDYTHIGGIKMRTYSIISHMCEMDVRVRLSNAFERFHWQPLSQFTEAI